MRLMKWFAILVLCALMALPAYADVGLPSQAMVIEAEAFRNDTSLVGKLTLPEGITTIGDYAFAGCTGLSEVIVPQSVTSIGAGAFSGCTNLSVTVLNTDAVIAADAFAHCKEVWYDQTAPETDFIYEITDDEVTIRAYVPLLP